MYKIGKYQSDNNLFLAPMAGVTDLPFRKLCKEFGAGWLVSEMVWSQKNLVNTKKTSNRLQHAKEISPKIVQIAGGDPTSIAESAIFNVKNGAEIIDINMGCPAKKVCKKAAGSALMKDEKLVAKILEKTVNSVNVPVTLKIRTGWSIENKNAINIAKIAEASGIQSLAIHGRTREQKYTGYAEYDTIAEVKSNISIPVIANGDITSPEKAKFVLDYTGVDGLMIGRAAQGTPWIFQQILAYLSTGIKVPIPNIRVQEEKIINHLTETQAFYGPIMGFRIARKHIGWYLDSHSSSNLVKKEFNKIICPDEQVTFLKRFFNSKRII